MFEGPFPETNLDDWKKLTDELRALEIGKKVELQTESTPYTLESREDGLYISGDRKYCPEPRKLDNISVTPLGFNLLFSDAGEWINIPKFRGLRPLDNETGK